MATDARMKAPADDNVAIMSFMIEKMIAKTDD
jgi:hypothetical protein